MVTPSPTTVLLQDPLSEVTRKERRNLLSAAAVGIVVVKTGLVPTKITALGIEFSEADKRSFVLVAAAFVFYFVVAFVIYAWSDFAAWRNSLHDAQFESFHASGQHLAGDEGARYRDREKFHRNVRHFYRFVARPAYLLRAMLDFLIPVVVGVYAFISLLRR